MDVSEVPQDQTDNFPAGISEETFDTWKEALAFISGINFAGDNDIDYFGPFERDAQWVVRVKVGDFDDEDFDDEDFDDEDFDKYKGKFS